MQYLVFLGALLFSGWLQAGPWATGQDKVVMAGYDPVAYFAEAGAVRGNPAHALAWDGATWWFSSQANLERFKASPQSYAPQYGAHCANGLSDGHVVPGNPENWRIIDGKLYLFYSAWGRLQWAVDVEEQIALANDTWSSFLSQQVRR